MRPLIAVLCGTSTTRGTPLQVQDFARRPYCDAVRRAGGAPVLVPLADDEAAVRSAVGHAQGLLITGGVDIAPGVYGEETLPECGEIDPLRDAADGWALREALDRNLPVLGVCRGIQSLAAFLGGSLHQDIPNHRQSAARNVATHDVVVEAGSLLARIVGAGALPANTFHHQAVKGVPPGFRVTARAGDDVIEGLEATDGSFRLGVQWHPEDLAPEVTVHQALFDALVEAAQ